MTESSPTVQPMTLEQEIARIEQDLASKRSALEKQRQTGQIANMPHEKETLREVLGEKIGITQPSAPPLSQVPANPITPTPSPVVEPPAYLSPELKEKVQELVNIAFTQNLETAIKQARDMKNAALIDAFHDALVDELYNYLLERGKLQKL